MSIACPQCGAEYDVTLFAFGKTVQCTCGRTVDARAPREKRVAPAPTGREENPLAVELRRRADAITSMILYSDLPRVDVEIAIDRLRSWVDDHLPDRRQLFEMVYESRWARLRDQGWERERPDA